MLTPTDDPGTDLEPVSSQEEAPPSIDFKVSQLLFLQDANKVDGSKLKMQRFQIREVNLEENQMPMLEVEPAEAADYVEFKACNQAKKCMEGTIYTDSHTIPGLSVGLVRIATRACVRAARALVPEEVCGPWEDSIFYQKPPIRERLDQLLSEKISYQEKIKKLGPFVIKAVQTYKANISKCQEEKLKGLIDPKILDAYLGIGAELIGVGLIDPKAQLVLSEGSTKRLLVLSNMNELDAQVYAPEKPARSGKKDESEDEKKIAAKVSVIAGAMAIVTPVAAKIAAKRGGKMLQTHVKNSSAGEKLSSRWVLGVGIAALLSLVVYGILEGTTSGKEFGSDFLVHLLSLTEKTPCELCHDALSLLQKIDQDASDLRKKITIVDQLITKELGGR